MKAVAVYLRFLQAYVTGSPSVGGPGHADEFCTQWHIWLMSFDSSGSRFQEDFLALKPSLEEHEWGQPAHGRRLVLPVLH